MLVINNKYNTTNEQNITFKFMKTKQYTNK